MSLRDAATNYVLLTIGDGLVAQVPSLVLSTAAAVIVTRVSAARDMGQQVAEQLLGSPRALFVSAGILGASRRGARHAQSRFSAPRRGARGPRRVSSPSRADRTDRRRYTAAAAEATSAARGSVVGRRPTARHGRPRTGLSPDSARRRTTRWNVDGAHQRRAAQAVAGAGIPAAAGAHPRQPRSAADRLSRQSAGCAGRRSGGRARSRAGHQSRRGSTATSAAKRRAIRRSASTPSGSTPRDHDQAISLGLHRRRSRHRHRYASEPGLQGTRTRAARSRGGAEAARPSRHRVTRNSPRVWCPSASI